MTIIFPSSTKTAKYTIFADTQEKIATLVFKTIASTDHFSIRKVEDLLKIVKEADWESEDYFLLEFSGDRYLFKIVRDYYKDKLVAVPELKDEWETL